MAGQAHQKVKEIFNAALRHTPVERFEFLDHSCGEDVSLRLEVESLLSSYESAEDFLEKPAIGDVAETLISQKPQLTSGQRFGNYEIIELIGSGGMGEVYLARESALRRKVALKLLPANLIRDQESLKRFEREARAVSSLNHPNILTIYATGEQGGIHFISTEHVKGVPLSERCGPSENLDLSETLEIAVQITSALSAAHDAGIIHRDIKPENVMVRDDGIVKVLDFGLAKLTDKYGSFEGDSESRGPRTFRTSKGIVMGTAPYMSPEQARGLKTDVRTDIWSLGVILYEMIAGEKLFKGETPSDIIAEIIRKEPVPVGELVTNLPSDLEKVVSKALSKDRRQRYQTASELKTDLEKIRHDIEFEFELERSGAPDRNADSENGALARPASMKDLFLYPTISAEYLFGQIRSHKTFAISIVPALLIAVLAAGFYFMFDNKAPALTDKDVILLIDFENKTGEKIFDGTLKQGLLIQLKQSPFLSVFPEAEIHKTLELMKRAPEERLTRHLGREICRRKGLKAYVVGTISKLGNLYVVGLEAVNAGTGEKIAITQSEAETKEKVPEALSKIAAEMRENLGEPLALIEKFDKPLEVTTESLEALKAYSMGKKQQSAGDSGARQLYKRAVEIDPEFASAYLALGLTFGPQKWKSEAITKAYKLREKVSEREKFSIAYYYYDQVLWDPNQMIASMKIGKLLYPRDEEIRIGIVRGYYRTGQYENVIQEARELLQLEPSDKSFLILLVQAYTNLNRFVEAKEAILTHRQKPTDFNMELYQIAFAENDTYAAQKMLEILREENNKRFELELALTAAYRGRWRRALDLFGQIVHPAGYQPNWLINVQMLEAATLDQCEQAKLFANRILPVPSRLVDPRYPGDLAHALAKCGDIARAQELMSKITREFPKAPLIKRVWLPIIKAEIELLAGRPEEAVKLLAATEYDAVAEFRPQYIRGRAFLRLNRNEKARMEFQKILDHRGEVILSPLYPLAQLGKARAMKDKREYEKFFEMWKDADKDLPALVNARKEYEKLK